VALGKYRRDKDESPMQVAIKVLKKEDARLQLLEEACVMAQVDHPNLVRSLGVCTTGRPMMLVLEFAAHGPLNDFLKEHSTGLAKMSPEMQMQASMDVLEGMAYLEAVGLIHRDLAARNVLLDHEYRCKVSDFGLAKFGSDDDTYYVAENLDALPVRWLAPEALEHQKCGS